MLTQTHFSKTRRAIYRFRSHCRYYCPYTSSVIISLNFMLSCLWHAVYH